MDVFHLRQQLIADYEAYSKSFVRIRDRDIREYVDEELDSGVLWPDPLIQLNPRFKAGETVDIMPVATGPRSTRLMRAMALGKDHSPLSTCELAAFLDKAEPERVERARPEAERVLGLIADTAEDKKVRKLAKELLDANP